jgi:hypothetical protein
MVTDNELIFSAGSSSVVCKLAKDNKMSCLETTRLRDKIPYTFAFWTVAEGEQSGNK